MIVAYFFAAYLIIWLLTFVYLMIMRTKVNQLKKEIDLTKNSS